MKKLIIFFLGISYYAVAQSTLISPKALVLPTYDDETAVRTAIPTPARGTLIYNTSSHKLMMHEPISDTWNDLISSYHFVDQDSPILKIRNENISFNANAILAETNSQDGGRAIIAKAKALTPFADTYGLVGENASVNAFGGGVMGLHRGNGTGVRGESLGIGRGVHGLSNDGPGVYGSSNTNVAVYGSSGSIGSYFEGFSHALLTGQGNIGLGTNIDINLNADERVDIKGRVRVRHAAQTAGIWFNNSDNTIGSTNGAFFGIQVPTPGAEKAGIFVGGQWNLTVDRLGNTCVRGIVQSNGACTPSDFRYKKNINPLNNALSNILKLNGVSYLYRKDEFPDQQFSDKNQIGLIAQDVEALYPEMVFTDEKGYKSVDYAKLTPVLVEAIKEQQSRIEKLELLVLKTEQMARDMATLKSMLTTQNTK
jgi:hypothetical protein